MRMYVKVMAAVIACILMSGETHSTSATIPATENQSWFKKRKKKPEQEEKTKSDYEKLVEGSKITKGMFAVHQKKNDYYFEIPTSLLGRYDSRHQVHSPNHSSHGYVKYSLLPMHEQVYRLLLPF